MLVRLSTAALLLLLTWPPTGALAARADHGLGLELGSCSSPTDAQDRLALIVRSHGARCQPRGLDPSLVEGTWPWADVRLPSARALLAEQARDLDTDRGRTLPGRHLASPSGASPELEGRLEGVRYRLRAGAISKSEKKLWRPDRWRRHGVSLDAEVDLGRVKPKLELERTLADDDMDPRRPRLTDSRGKLALDLVPIDHSLVTLSFGRETRERASRMTGRASQHVSTDHLSGTLWYGRSSWSAYATSTRFSLRDSVKADSDATIRYHSFGGEVGQLGLSFNPSVAWTETTYPSADYATTDLSANIGVSHPGSGWLPALFLWGSYGAESDSEGAFDARTLGLSLMLERDLPELSALPYRERKIGLELGYDRYDDRLSPDSGETGVRALFLFRLRP